MKLRSILDCLIQMDDVREGIRKIRGMLSVQKVKLLQSYVA